MTMTDATRYADFSGEGVDVDRPEDVLECEQCEDAVATMVFDKGPDVGRYIGQAARFVHVCEACHSDLSNYEPPDAF